jgi:hypothetical protein
LITQPGSALLIDGADRLDIESLRAEPGAAEATAPTFSMCDAGFSGVLSSNAVFSIAIKARLTHCAGGAAIEPGTHTSGQLASARAVVVLEDAIEAARRVAIEP